MGEIPASIAMSSNLLSSCTRQARSRAVRNGTVSNRDESGTLQLFGKESSAPKVVATNYWDTVSNASEKFRWARILSGRSPVGWMSRLFRNTINHFPFPFQTNLVNQRQQSDREFLVSLAIVLSVTLRKKFPSPSWCFLSVPLFVLGTCDPEEERQIIDSIGKTDICPCPRSLEEIPSPDVIPSTLFPFRFRETRARGETSAKKFYR